MKNNLISVIIPIYNSEKFLCRCVDSVLNQTYSNLEIILVNDGSTDKSEEICLKYVKKDSRVKYFYKKNSGAGDTRNYGIKKANGKYIGFIDSDDEALPTMYEELYNTLKSNDVDISGCEYFNSDNSKKNVRYRKLKQNGGIQEKNRLILDILFQDNAWGAVWNKLFRREVFDKYHFSKTSLYEDYALIIPAFNEYKTFLIKKPLFIHYDNEYSLTHSIFKFEKLVVGMNVCDELENYLKNKNEYLVFGCYYFKLLTLFIYLSSNYKNVSKSEYDVVKGLYNSVSKYKILNFKFFVLKIKVFLYFHIIHVK